MSVSTIQQNHIDHVIYILDGSGSMSAHKGNLIQVVDNQTRHLAEKYQLTEQETRVSVFRFSGRFEFDCLVYDTDVLRTPSIAQTYKATNMTALIDATIKTIDHLLKVPTEFGDHAFLVYILTDGLENASAGTAYQLKAKLNSLPDNWTFAGFVPDKRAIKELADCGVPAANIREWNTQSADGVLEVGQIIRDTTDNFKEARKTGVRGTKSLFTLNTVTVADIKNKLKPVYSTTNLMTVMPDEVGPNGKVQIKDFVSNRLHIPYKVGDFYYELVEKETIQPKKNVILMANNKFWHGEMSVARGLLGLPDGYVDVKPGVYNGYTIFVQSKSINRVFRPGERLLYVPGLTV